jgi:hypothetical protein
MIFLFFFAWEVPLVLSHRDIFFSLDYLIIPMR